MFKVLSPAALIRRRNRLMENVARAEYWKKVPNVRPSIPKKEKLQHLSLEGRIILKYILREKY